jgi:hypothetical protein
MVPLLATRDHSLWTAIAGASPVARIRDKHVTMYGRGRGLSRHEPAVAARRSQRDHLGHQLPGDCFDSRRSAGVGSARRTVCPRRRCSRSSRIASDRCGWRRPCRLSTHRGWDALRQGDDIDISSNVWHGFTEDSHGQMWMSDFRSGFRRVGSKKPEHHPRWGIQLLNDASASCGSARRGRGCGACATRVEPAARSSTASPRMRGCRATRSCRSSKIAKATVGGHQCRVSIDWRRITSHR